MILGRFYSLVIVFVVIGVGVEALHDGLVVRFLSFGTTKYFGCHVFPSSSCTCILFFSCFLVFESLVVSDFESRWMNLKAFSYFWLWVGMNEFRSICSISSFEWGWVNLGAFVLGAYVYALFWILWVLGDLKVGWIESQFGELGWFCLFFEELFKVCRFWSGHKWNVWSFLRALIHKSF